MSGNIYEKLVNIQSELRAPKSNYNKFGKYNYRSCEDILEALKPLLVKHSCAIVISDEIVEIAGRFYVKATVKLYSVDGNGGVSTSALAREAETKKGMDEAQVTGAASSYARKYALNAMFAIDDVKDPDATNKHGKDESKVNHDELYEKLATSIDKCKSVEDLTAWGKKHKKEIDSLPGRLSGKIRSYAAQMMQAFKQDTFGDKKDDGTISCPNGKGNVFPDYCDMECKERKGCSARGGDKK